MKGDKCSNLPFPGKWTTLQKVLVCDSSKCKFPHFPIDGSEGEGEREGGCTFWGGRREASERE